MSKVYLEDQAPPGMGYSEEYEVKYYLKYLAPDGKIYQSQNMTAAYRTQEKHMHEEVLYEFRKAYPYAHVIRTDCL